MAYLVVDEYLNEWIYDISPVRDDETGTWEVRHEDTWFIQLPKGTIEKITGKKLTWKDEPHHI